MAAAAAPVAAAAIAAVNLGFETKPVTYACTMTMLNP